VVIASKGGFRKMYEEENLVLLDHESVEKNFDMLAGA